MKLAEIKILLRIQCSNVALFLQVTSLEEENASLKVRLRHMDGLELERDELVRQLDSAKEDLFNEQRQSRNKIEELQEVSYLPFKFIKY